MVQASLEQQNMATRACAFNLRGQRHHLLGGAVAHGEHDDAQKHKRHIYQHRALQYSVFNRRTSCQLCGLDLRLLQLQLHKRSVYLAPYPVSGEPESQLSQQYANQLKVCGCLEPLPNAKHAQEI